MLCYDMPMKMLGVDYGSKYVGIAISDDNGNIAFPHEVVERRYAHDTIVKLVASKHIKAIIVGESLDAQGRRNAIGNEADAFASRLRDELKLPVVFERESFTSWHARQRIPEHRGTISRLRQERVTESRVDAAAAALILQRYLDRGIIPTL
jgi:putative Holliday junction resolvase